MEDECVPEIREVFTSGFELEKGINKLKKITSSRENPVTAPTSTFASDMVELLLLKKLSIFFVIEIYSSIFESSV